MATKPLSTIKTNPNNGQKTTTAQTKDGSYYTFSGDNWINFANDNGIDPNSLSKALTYPAYVTANEANSYLNNTANSATAEAKKKNPNNVGIQGTTFGAGIYDKPSTYNHGSYNYTPSTYNYGNYNYTPTGATSTGNARGYYAGGGIPQYQGISMDDLYNMYSGGFDGSRQAAQNSFDTFMQQIGYQKDEVNDTIDRSNKDAFVNMKMAEKNLPQQMAANGLTGGLTESSLLGLRSDYGKTYAENERTRASEINELNMQAQAKAAEVMQTIAGYDAQAAQMATNAYINMVQAENDYNQWAYTAMVENDRYAEQQAADAQNVATSFAKTLIDIALETGDVNLLNQVLDVIGNSAGVDLTGYQLQVDNGGGFDLSPGGLRTATPTYTPIGDIDKKLLGNTLAIAAAVQK